MKYGIRFDIDQVGPDTASAFMAFRSAGLEIDSILPEVQNPILDEAIRVLRETPELQQALTKPESYLAIKVAAVGANLCSSANDPSGQLD